nr:MAG: hypothetical protein [Bacteriophage sp.]
MKTLIFDVMLNGRFICTLRYKYCPLFPIEIDELVKLVLSKRPTLKGQAVPYRFLVQNEYLCTQKQESA